MMNFFFTALALLLPPSAAADAADAHFTTVFLDDEGVVYTGIKSGEQSGESAVVSFPFNSGVRTNIPLPAEIFHREVIGLLTEKQKLFVITNGNGEKDDGPMLHVYNRGNGLWSKVGKVACSTFTKVTLRPTQMVFSCEVGKSKRGKTHMERKTIHLKHERIYRGGVWRFPEFMLRYKGRTVLLEGSAPFWDKLRLRSDSEGQRTITAKELLQLPLPGDATNLLPENAAAPPNGIAPAGENNSTTIPKIDNQ